MSVAAMVKVAFHAQAGHGEGPADVLAGMNEMLGHRLHEQFVTAGYACIDTAAGTITYAGAGHPPLYIMSARRGVEDMMSNGLILGPFPDARYSSVERRLEPGDRVVMYTDGIVEAFNEKDEEFGDGRLRELLSKSVALSVDGFADRLLHDVKQWSGIGRTRSLADDVTLIVIDVLPIDLPPQTGPNPLLESGRNSETRAGPVSGGQVKRVSPLSDSGPLSVSSP